MLGAAARRAGGVDVAVGGQVSLVHGAGGAVAAARRARRVRATGTSRRSCGRCSSPPAWRSTSSRCRTSPPRVGRDGAGGGQRRAVADGRRRRPRRDRAAAAAPRRAHVRRRDAGERLAAARRRPLRLRGSERVQVAAEPARDELHGDPPAGAERLRPCVSPAGTRATSRSPPTTARRCGWRADARRFDLSPAWLSWVGAAPALALLEEVGVEAIHAHDVGLAEPLPRGAWACRRATRRSCRCGRAAGRAPARGRRDGDRARGLDALLVATSTRRRPTWTALWRSSPAARCASELRLGREATSRRRLPSDEFVDLRRTN